MFVQVFENLSKKNLSEFSDSILVNLLELPHQQSWYVCARSQIRAVAENLSCSEQTSQLRPGEARRAFCFQLSDSERVGSRRAVFFMFLCFSLVGLLF